MKFEVGSKVRVLDTDQVTEVIEAYPGYLPYYPPSYLCDDGDTYEENELDWAK